MSQLFIDRHEAGQRLVAMLEEYRGQDAVVLALPRGGIPVGYEIAKALDLPLEPFIVRKLGVPSHRELAMGALASGGVRVLDPDTIAYLRIPAAAIDAVIMQEERELARREALYGSSGTPRLGGRIAILVDDGLATGSSMRAAILAVRKHRPARVVVAVPVGAPDTCAALREEADDVICLQMPEPFGAVGAWYQRFGQTTDAEVRALLDEVRHGESGASVAASLSRSPGSA